MITGAGPYRTQPEAAAAAERTVKKLNVPAAPWRPTFFDEAVGSDRAWHLQRGYNLADDKLGGQRVRCAAVRAAQAWRRSLDWEEVVLAVAAELGMAVT